MKRNKKNLIVGTLVLISLFAIVGITKAVFQYTPTAPVIYNQKAESNYKTFTSKSLGISFQYEGGIYKNPVFVKKIGNKVYLYLNYTGKEGPTSGKFVEVLSKNPKDSLSDAIKKQFLQGFSSTDCPIVSPKIDRRIINTSYKYAQISVPGPFDGTVNLRNQAKLCPTTYTYNGVTGLAYFVMDPKHPNKYAFFKLGQSPILGAPPQSAGNFAKTWDLTLKFL